ncbi:hypothetical protein [Pseudooctadecabacter sp.]|uniref:hypothetical protein n=1 Tax=Pseudooctadecabacter sp. TaxID=1966338 RepID=UPI0035C7EAF6
MTTLMSKFKSAVSTTVVCAAGVVMMGLGFALVGTLALFGLVAIGIALLAAPFVAPTLQASADADPQTAA